MNIVDWNHLIMIIKIICMCTGNLLFSAKEVDGNLFMISLILRVVKVVLLVNENEIFFLNLHI